MERTGFLRTGLAVAAAGLEPRLELEAATAALEQAGRNAIKGAGLLLKSG